MPESLFEKITFLIAVAGFFMSAITWVREWLHRRNNLALSIIDYGIYKNKTGGIIQFFLIIQNKSSLPVAIAKISIQLDEEWYDCKLEPTLIKEISGHLVYTPRFPLILGPYASAVEYFEFLTNECIPLAPGRKIVFRIHTSRGNITLSSESGKQAHYLHNE